jgi:hypothetical protein
MFLSASNHGSCGVRRPVSADRPGSGVSNRNDPAGRKGILQRVTYRMNTCPAGPDGQTPLKSLRSWGWNSSRFKKSLLSCHQAPELEVH